jgi:hypothetical protein
MKRSKAVELGQPILAKFCGATVAGVPPRVMGIGPSAAIPKLLAKFQLAKDDIDIFEINEAFASMAVYCLNVLGLDHAKMNPRGGAIALGHPLGATGARQICTILSEARRTQKKILVTSMCVSRPPFFPLDGLLTDSPSRSARAKAWPACLSTNRCNAFVDFLCHRWILGLQIESIHFHTWFQKRIYSSNIQIPNQKCPSFPMVFFPSPRRMLCNNSTLISTASTTSKIPSPSCTCQEYFYKCITVSIKVMFEKDN